MTWFTKYDIRITASYEKPCYTLSLVSEVVKGVLLSTITVLDNIYTKYLYSVYEILHFTSFLTPDIVLECNIAVNFNLVH